MKNKIIYSGFTLPEILISLSLIVLLSYYGTDQYIEKYYQQMIDRGLSDTFQLGLAAQSYLVSNQDYFWPDEAKECLGASAQMSSRGFIFHPGTKNVWGNDIIFSCPLVSPSSMFRPSLIITQKVPDHLAVRFINALPGASEGNHANGLTEVHTFVTRPQVTYQNLSTIIADASGAALITKPACSAQQTAQLSVSPSMVCSQLDKPLRGFKVEVNNQPNAWQIRLMVKDENNIFQQIASCGGLALEFQLIKLCG